MPTGGRPRSRPGKEVMTHGESSSSLHIQDPLVQLMSNKGHGGEGSSGTVEQTDDELVRMLTKDDGGEGSSGTAGQTDDEPMYMTQLLNTVQLIIPFLGFALGLVGYLQDNEMDKYGIATKCCMTLVGYSLVACVGLLGIYQRAVKHHAEDPGTSAKVRFFKLTVYTTLLLAFGWSSVLAFIPGTTGEVIGYALAVAAVIFLLLAFFCDVVPCSERIRRVYEHCIRRPHHQLEPMIVTHHRQTFLHIIFPMLAFVVAILIFILKQIREKDQTDPWLKDNQAFMILAFLLVVYCAIMGFVILRVYSRPTTNPETTLNRFYSATFYAAGYTAWGISVTMAFIPYRSLVIVLWRVILGTASVFVLVYTLLDGLKWLWGRIYACFATILNWFLH